jgi:hypothetical protein
MPNRKTPPTVRVLRGGKTSDSEPSIDTDVGEPSEHLSDYEKAIWIEITSAAPDGVICKPDRFSLEMICRLIADMRLNFDDMSAAKMTQLSNLLGKYGLTPADRSKVSIPGKPSGNPFSEI